MGCQFSVNCHKYKNNKNVIFGIMSIYFWAKSGSFWVKKADFQIGRQREIQSHGRGFGAGCTFLFFWKW